MAVNKAYTSMLPTASDLEGALFNVSEVNADSDTGYESKKASISEVGAEIVSELEWQTELTETTDKTITGAINEIASDLDDVKDEVADLKDLEGSASGAIASFADGTDNPLRALTISIVATQSGSGDPSPDNVRPITGWTGATINVSGEDTSDPTTYNIDWQSVAGTVYGGTLNVKTGVLTVTHKLYTFNGTENWVKLGSTSASAFAMNVLITDVIKLPNTSAKLFKSNFLKPILSGETWGAYHHFVSTNAASRIVAGIDTITTAEDWKAYLAEHPLQVLCELATPTTYQLTPTEVRSLLGINNIWADCGAITELKYTRDLNLCINDIIARIEALEGGSNSRSISVLSNLTKSLTSDSNANESILEDTKETEEETKEEAQNER